MSFSHTLTEKITTDGHSVEKSNTYTGGLQVSLSEAVADSETDYEIVVTMDVSEIESVMIVSDQDVTLETNSGDTPDDTLSLVAGVPYVWTSDSYHVCLLTTDITSIFITNASGSEATLKIEAVIDPTPA